VSGSQELLARPCGGPVGRAEAAPRESSASPASPQGASWGVRRRKAVCITGDLPRFGGRGGKACPSAVCFALCARQTSEGPCRSRHGKQGGCNPATASSRGQAGCPQGRPAVDVTFGSRPHIVNRCDTFRGVRRLSGAECLRAPEQRGRQYLYCGRRPPTCSVVIWKPQLRAGVSWHAAKMLLQDASPGVAKVEALGLLSAPATGASDVEKVGCQPAQPRPLPCGV